MDQSKRLFSLDVFRGITILLMIIVNNPGSWGFVYSPLRHSKWNGCTPTDLVFPFFMFIMGTAMYYSFKKYNFSLNKNSFSKVIKRTLIIFLIGLLLNAFPFVNVDLSHLRIMGVLPRIAIAYCFASIIILGLRLTYVKIITVAILLGYWILLMTLGGIEPYSLNGNFVRSFDIFILGINHVPTNYGVVFDITGLLSTLPSIASVLLGFLIGRIIDKEANRIRAVYKLLIEGFILIVAAFAWNFIFPINKPLWTSSFVLYTSGWAIIILGILLWIIDIRGFKKWSHPILVFGLNPLFIYVMSCIWADSLDLIKIRVHFDKLKSLKEWIFTHIFSAFAGNMIGSLLFAIHLGILFWFVAWFLERKQIFIKI